MWTGFVVGRLPKQCLLVHEHLAQKVFRNTVCEHMLVNNVRVLDLGSWTNGLGSWSQDLGSMIQVTLHGVAAEVNL